MTLELNIESPNPGLLSVTNQWQMLAMSEFLKDAEREIAVSKARARGSSDEVIYQVKQVE